MGGSYYYYPVKVAIFEARKRSPEELPERAGLLVVRRVAEQIWKADQLFHRLNRFGTLHDARLNHGMHGQPM